MVNIRSIDTQGTVMLGLKFSSDIIWIHATFPDSQVTGDILGNLGVTKHLLINKLHVTYAVMRGNVKGERLKDTQGMENILPNVG